MCPANKEKLEVKAIYELLGKYNALIVHFSGAPKGAGVEREDHLYPNDIQYVLNGHASSGLSTSTVMPDDVFHGYERNATGSIGVILGLKDSTSLRDAHPRDCGSMIDEEGNRITHNKNPLFTIDDLEATILSRELNSYNEWIIRDFEVMGILAVEPLDICYLTDKVQIGDSMEFMILDEPIMNIRSIEFEDVLNDFSNQPIYTFKDSEIYQITKTSLSKIQHKDIYKY